MLRLVTIEDVALLFGWANDPTTRANSFNSAPLDWDAHVIWWREALESPRRLAWLLVVDDRPVASIRFEEFGDEAKISLQVAPDQRGKGYGHRAVVEATERYVSTTSRRVIAEIRPENRASIATFAKSGYVMIDSGDPLRFASGR